MKNEQKIPFRNQADQMVSVSESIKICVGIFLLELDMEAGDVIVLLQIQDHPVFKREGNDLFMTKKITLVEALCGFTMYITHLDKRVLEVNCPQGMVIEPCEFGCGHAPGLLKLFYNLCYF